MFEIYQDDKPEGVAELLPQSEEAMNSDIELAIAAYDKCWKKEEAMFEKLAELSEAYAKEMREYRDKILSETGAWSALIL